MSESSLSSAPVAPAEAGARHRVEPCEAGWRLDHFLTARHPGQSRSFFQKLAQQGHIRVNDAPAGKAGQRLRAGDTVEFSPPPPEPARLTPERVDFPILHEDEDLLLINKPPGLVVHPGNGHRTATLANGLLHLYRHLPGVEEGRAGLVHRLDKDTSGILLAAKNEPCLRALMTAFQERRVEKRYLALLLRAPKTESGRVVAPLGRHPVARQKMAVREDGRFAATTWRVVERFANGWCLADIGLETGRTHQIRVHMASLGCPVAGDEVYGGAVSSGASPAAPRQMLHARTLRFVHPTSGASVSCTAPLWPDMEALLAALRDLPQSAQSTRQSTR